VPGSADAVFAGKQRMYGVFVMMRVDRTQARDER